MPIDKPWHKARKADWHENAKVLMARNTAMASSLHPARARS